MASDSHRALPSFTGFRLDSVEFVQVLFRFLRAAPHLADFRPVAVHVNYHSDKGWKMARFAPPTPPLFPSLPAPCCLLRKSIAVQTRLRSPHSLGLPLPPNRSQVLIADEYLEHKNGSLNRCEGDGCKVRPISPRFPPFPP